MKSNATKISRESTPYITLTNSEFDIWADPRANVCTILTQDSKNSKINTYQSGIIGNTSKKLTSTLDRKWSRENKWEDIVSRYCSFQVIFLSSSLSSSFEGKSQKLSWNLIWGGRKGLRYWVIFGAVLRQFLFQSTVLRFSESKRCAVSLNLCRGRRWKNRCVAVNCFFFITRRYKSDKS